MEVINGLILREMLLSGCNNLNNQKKEIDARNVFPVPDGDTGTNMSLTFNNGMSEVNKSNADVLSDVAKIFSRGLLMGARGNSGVILSQIFRGFAKEVKDKKEVNVAELASAMCRGSEVAYKAVMRPVEGTILTVIREASTRAKVYAEENVNITVEEYIDVLGKEAKDALDHTPDLLPVLKEAGVVDSGGSGLVVIFDGFRAYLQGAPIQALSEKEREEREKNERRSGYATEFILEISDANRNFFKKDEFYKKLEHFGNNITLRVDKQIVKVHINTMTPGEILTMGERYGEFRKIQIENFKFDQSPSILEENEETEQMKEFGIIAIATGEGIANLFKEYRSDYVVEGGQTMNPSTEDICAAIDKVNAQNIYVLPNNSNIIMAAKQATYVNSEKNIIVLETTSIPQGLSACIAFNPDADLKENTEAMKEAIASVKTGQVTYAIKDTTFNGKTIKTGDYMGLFDKEIRVVNKDKVQTAIELIDEMIDEDAAIVTLFKGVDASDEETETIAEHIRAHYDVDVDTQDGGQPVYAFVIGVE